MDRDGYRHDFEACDGMKQANNSMERRSGESNPEPEWRQLRGLGADPDLMEKFAEHRRAEREREDAGV